MGKLPVRLQLIPCVRHIGSTQTSHFSSLLSATKTATFGRSISRNRTLTSHLDMPRRDTSETLSFHSDPFREQTAGQRDLIFASHAQALLKAKRYFPAAQAFAQCSIPFEDVALKFLDANERDALRSYLMLRLEQTRKSVCVDSFVFLVETHNGSRI
jgi:hypothetical protein